MSGLSGSGKTTIAQQLAKQNNAIHIRSDAVRKYLAGIPLSQTGEQSIYSSEMTEKTYNRLLEFGTMLVMQGFNVVLDAKYDLKKWRETVINFVQSHNISFEIIYCTAPVEVLSDRLRNRTQDISDATADLLAQQQANFEPFQDHEKAYVTTIDTN
jgi:predicted kinase